MNKKAIKALAKNKKIAGVIATLSVISALGYMNIDTEKNIKVGKLDNEEVYITKAVTMEDARAYASMITYEIEQSGGKVDLEDIDSKNKEKGIIVKLNNKFSRREPDEIKDEKEKNQYKLAKDILMKKSENRSTDYLINAFESDKELNETIIKEVIK